MPEGGFKQMLDDFDSLIAAADGGIGQLQIDTARKYVSEIMMELKKNPDYDAILIDRDVHNVMLFVRASRENAVADFVTQKKKAAERADKKAAKMGTMQFDMSILSGDAPASNKAALAAAAIAEFATLDTSNIPAITSRSKK